MPAIRAVVFDLGHTLWDLAPEEERRRAAFERIQHRLREALGDIVPPPEALDAALGLHLQAWLEAEQQAADLRQPPVEPFVDRALRSVGLEVADDLLQEVMALALSPEVDPPIVHPETPQVLATLHSRGLKLGSITNTMLSEDGVQQALQYAGLDTYFQSVVVSSAIGYRKPHASLFLRALEELNTAPKEAIFVGDRLLDDISGARAAGMRTVLTHQYRQEPLDNVTLRPDAVIRRLSELPAVLDRLSATLPYQ